MKRNGKALLLSALLLVGTLSGCGAAKSMGASDNSMTAPGAGGEFATGARDEGFQSMAAADAAESPSAAPAESGTQETKRIYTGSLTLETTAFDEAAEKLAELVERCGGYFERSSVDNYGSGYRMGWYTVRVPSEKFDEFRTQAGTVCHVLSQSAAVEDVSEYYYDTAGRLTTQQTKLERLRTLLTRAESMEDIITIESAISETESQIERLSGELQHYDALVDYAAVEVSLEEVYRLSNTEEPATGFASRLGTAFSSGWKNFVSGVGSFFIALAYGWVWVILAAVVLGAAAAALVRRRKRRAMTAPKTPMQPPNGGEK